MDKSIKYLLLGLAGLLVIALGIRIWVDCIPAPETLLATTPPT